MKMKYGFVLVVACLIVAVGPAATAATSQHPVSVESVVYSGQAVATTPDQPLHVWQSDSHQFSTELRANESLSNGSLCLVADGGSEDRELACDAVELAAGDVTEATMTVDAWPNDLTGEQTVEAVLRNGTSGRTLDAASLSLNVLEREGDLDGDGLENEAEVEHGTDIDDPDTDDDMLSDAVEVGTYDTSPTDPDSDSDGLEDGTEIREHHTDPTETDTDDDGLSDGREIEIGTIPTRADTDGDGLEDGPERNRYQTNATNVDTDDDGLTDAAEVNDYASNPTESDTDDDGLTDGEEVSLYDTDPTLSDTDGDGLDDAAEVQTHYTDPTEADTDGDGIDDESEIREHGTDPLAADTDRDGVDDGTEIELGSDPTNPGDTADPGLTYTLASTVTDRPLSAGLLALLVATGAVLALSERFGWRLSLGSLNRALVGPESKGDDPPESGAAASGDANAGPETASREGLPETEDRDPEAAETEPETAESDSESTVPTDPSILTNEERVIRLLDERDGRMLQSDIVEAGDWSKATVSRVLSQMEEEGDVTRVDIGKGNLVARPGDEPANANSPFSE